jgi:hypothetical protein
MFCPRNKDVLVIGRRGRGPAARGLFTPCKTAPSLLKAIAEAARSATSGDVVLLSPACSSFDQFRKHQQSGGILYQTAKSTGWGVRVGDPNMNGKMRNNRIAPARRAVNLSSFASVFFEEKPEAK